MYEVATQQSGEMVSRNTQTEMMISRQAQEVQGAMVIAKRFPRDEVESFNRIMQSCKRKSLAESAMYEYPRGGTKVSGPSIRLAEAMAQNWGNIDFGITELEQKNGESQVMAYAWDLETNTRQVKIFSVPHVRGTKKGNVPLTDPRDVYEMVANQGARRLRSCILGIIPGDVVEAAVKQCEDTLINGEKKPLIDLVRDMAAIFQNEFGVPLDAIEKYIGCKSEAFSMRDLVRLKKVYTSLRDGMAKREDVFELSTLVGNETEREVKDPFANQQKDGKSSTAKRGVKNDENTKKAEADTATVAMAALRKCYKQICPDGNEGKPVYFSYKKLIDYLKGLNEEQVETGEFYKTGANAGLPKKVKGEYNGRLHSIISTLEDKSRFI